MVRRNASAWSPVTCPAIFRRSSLLTPVLPHTPLAKVALGGAAWRASIDEYEGGDHIYAPVNAVVETEKLIIRASGSLRKLVLAVEAGA